MKHNTLDEINEKLLINIRKPIINIDYIIDELFKYLDVGFDGIIMMSIHSPDPRPMMASVEAGVKLMLLANESPISNIHSHREMNLLSMAIEYIGIERLENLIYQYMIVMIPKVIMENQIRQQQYMADIHMLQNYPCIGGEN